MGTERPDPDVQYIVRRSPFLNVERKGFTAGTNFNSSYKVTKTFTVQGFVYASTRAPEIQGTGPANLYYQMGVKKTLLDGKADLVLNFGSPSTGYWPYRTTTNTYTTANTLFHRKQRVPLFPARVPLQRSPTASARPARVSSAKASRTTILRAVAASGAD
ncbi:MAG: outer membrane beta-barrel protein [Hymenobacter sp.]